jgi:hypothetical protein
MGSVQQNIVRIVFIGFFATVLGIAGCSGGSSSSGSNDLLPDTDGDGINNDNDGDIDGDGIPNDEDTDIDGDGKPNDSDDDDDGDGIRDQEDNTSEGADPAKACTTTKIKWPNDDTPAGKVATVTWKLKPAGCALTKAQNQSVKPTATHMGYTTVGVSKKIGTLTTKINVPSAPNQGNTPRAVNYEFSEMGAALGDKTGGYTNTVTHEPPSGAVPEPPSVPETEPEPDTGDGPVTLSTAMANYESCLNTSAAKDCSGQRAELKTAILRDVRTEASTIDNSFNRFESYVSGSYTGKIKHVSLSDPVASPGNGRREFYVKANGEHCVGMGGTTFTLNNGATYKVTGDSNPLLTFVKNGGGHVSIEEDSLISQMCWGRRFPPRYVFDTQDNNQTYVMYIGSETATNVTATGVFEDDSGKKTTLTLKNGATKKHIELPPIDGTVPVDIDGDGIPNTADIDMDGDGILNTADIDIDGDGIANTLDIDIDGDGITNGIDPDADGDGTPDAEDETPGGPQ